MRWLRLAANRTFFDSLVCSCVEVLSGVDGDCSAASLAVCRSLLRIALLGYQRVLLHGVSAVALARAFALFTRLNSSPFSVRIALRFHIHHGGAELRLGLTLAALFFEASGDQFSLRSLRVLDARWHV